MYRAWKAKRPNLRPLKIDSTSKLLTPVMYDVKPHTYGTYRDLLGVLEETKGALCTINRSEFSVSSTVILKARASGDCSANRGLSWAP